MFSACTLHPHPAPAPEQEAEEVVVPAGWFLMGQNDDRRSNRPQREIYLDTFAIDRTEVTNAAFAKFLQESGYGTIGWDEEAATAR